MIIFDLRCDSGHVFEAWFGSAAAFERQRQEAMLECPMCASRHIEKAVMAPAVGAKGNRQQGDPARKALLARLAEQQRRLEAGCDYVGRDFAAEARRRHRAKPGRDQRGIIGEASIRQAMELADEGIPVQPLPFRPRQALDA